MSDLSSNLLQDALATLLFPRGAEASAIDLHLQRWADRVLPTPFDPKEPDQDTADCLITFWLHVVQLVEDYLGKATDPYPPRAYHGLPFSPTHDSVKGFDIYDLSPAERSRTMWAFLQYDLLTKVCHAENFYNPILKKSGLEPLQEYQDRGYSPVERELLMCVQEYFRTLYGSIFAYLAGAWLPCRPDTIAPRDRGTGLVYPENVCFKPSAYAEDLGLVPSTCSRIAIYLASYGIGLAVNLVRASLAGSLQASQLRKLSKMISKEKVEDFFYSSWRYGVMRARSWPGCTFAGSSWTGAPGMARLLSPRLYDHSRKETSDDEWDGMDSISDHDTTWEESDSAQMEMYRQRAWVFFDDWRLYPASWTKHFPTLLSIRALQTMSLDAYLSIDQARILHRSAAWNLQGASSREVLWADPASADEDGTPGDREELRPADVLRPWMVPCWELS